MKTTFTTKVRQEEGMNATGIQVPAEAVAALRTQKRPKVTVSLNGYTYRTTVAAPYKIARTPQSLSCTCHLRLDQRLRRLRHPQRRVFGSEHPHGHEGAVHQQEELVGQGCGVAGAGRLCQLDKTQAHRLLMLQCHGVRRMRVLGEIHHRVEKRAAEARRRHRQLLERLEESH